MGVAGALALIWASLGVFTAVSSAIGHAWGVERRRSFLMHRLVSFLMMVSAGGIFIIALVLASMPRVAETSWFWELVSRSSWYEKAKSDLKTKGRASVGGFVLGGGSSGSSSWSSGSSSSSGGFSGGGGSSGGGGRSGGWERAGDTGVGAD